MTTHVKILAVLFFVLGALGIIGALFSSLLFSVLATIVGNSHEEGAPVGVAVLGLTGFALTIYLLVTSIPSLICGWGLLKFRRWARLLGIILCAVTLINFPIGTAFGIYGLYVLFRKDTEALFA